MSSEYVLEIESFPTVKVAMAFAKKHIVGKHDKTINVVSRDITVIDLNEE